MKSLYTKIFIRGRMISSQYAYIKPCENSPLSYFSLFMKSIEREIQQFYDLVDISIG